MGWFNAKNEDKVGKAAEKTGEKIGGVIGNLGTGIWNAGRKGVELAGQARDNYQAWHAREREAEIKRLREKTQLAKEQVKFQREKAKLAKLQGEIDDPFSRRAKKIDDVFKDPFGR